MLEQEISLVKKIYLATEKEGNIALGVGESTYIINPRVVDVADFILTLLESPDLEIVGYDVKEDLKRLLIFQKPLQSVEGQGSLF